MGAAWPEAISTAVPPRARRVAVGSRWALSAPPGGCSLAAAMLETGSHVPVRRITPSARTVGDLFRKRCLATPSAPAMFEKVGTAWERTTWADFYEHAKRAAHGLRELGVRPGDKVAVLGPTRAPWAIYDMGAQLLGAVSFGIYPKQTPEQVRYLLEHSEAKVVLVDGEDELASVLSAAPGIATLSAIVPWTTALHDAHHKDDLRIRSPAVMRKTALTEAEVDASLGAIQPGGVAILVYTSGTTGPPKGAMVSHENILSLLEGQSQTGEFFEDDLSLNFLPMAHSAERIFGFFGRLNTGVATAYAQRIGTVLEDLGDVRPTMFGSVPRIFEKAYARVQGELEKKPPAVQRLFRWAIDVGKARAERERRGEPVPLAVAAQNLLADRLVHRKIRAAFGGRTRMLVTGAAPLARDILEFFWAVGLPIYEVYGMTESTVATHANRPGAVRLGTVGQPIAPIEAKIAHDGEVLIRGPWVFKGYFKNESATQETVVDGWLHTGDVGVIDADGFLTITDRKKHLIITAGGKNLAPANIENAIKNQDPLVSSVYAHGDRRPYVVALVAPSPLETLAFGVERGLVSRDEVDALTRELMENPSGRSERLNAAMSRVTPDPALLAKIKAAVVRGNERLAGVEKVRRFTLLSRDFSQESGELTPTMKLKRKAVAELHADAIAALYEGGGVEVLPGAGG